MSNCPHSCDAAEFRLTLGLLVCASVIILKHGVYVPSLKWFWILLFHFIFPFLCFVFPLLCPCSPSSWEPPCPPCHIFPVCIILPAVTLALCKYLTDGLSCHFSHSLSNFST